MPFFVISRSGTPSDVPDEHPTQVPLQAGVDRGHTSREAAEHEVERLRSERPDREYTIVEAASAMDAIHRSREPAAAPALQVELITTWPQMVEAIRLRYAVFIEEQGVPEEEELDEHDLPRAWGRTSVHALARLGAMQMPVATARMLIDVPPGEPAHIGRVAVMQQQRRHGHGRAVMRFLEAEARRRGFPGVVLHAQLHAVPFYEALGFQARGPVFLEAGIEHRAMELSWR